MSAGKGIIHPYPERRFSVKPSFGPIWKCSKLREDTQTILRIVSDP
jgi:hypothetical protein